MGDDLSSYGFDGAFLWSGGRKTPVNRTHAEEPYIRKGKVHFSGTSLDGIIIYSYGDKSIIREMPVFSSGRDIDRERKLDVDDDDLFITNTQ